MFDLDITGTGSHVVFVSVVCFVFLKWSLKYYQQHIKSLVIVIPVFFCIGCFCHAAHYVSRAACVVVTVHHTVML